MDFFDLKQIENNKSEYGQFYDKINFIKKEQVDAFEKKRNDLLKDISDNIHYLAKSSKLFTQKISYGCELCSLGTWSCLFINGICNAKCFFCPSIQNQKDVPTTNGTKFSSPDDYINYIEKFNLKGVSLSGGEPFLTYDATKLFIKKIKKKFSDKIYLWLYTNGILFNSEKAKELQDLGLDEIRFNIVHQNYNVDKLKNAVGTIRNVTVEIPAIPEDFDKLRMMTLVLFDLGVDYLNLHQLRLNPYNFNNIINRPYTYNHGTKVTILESEFTALELIKYTTKNKIFLPINYCSYIYKNRFQNLGARKRAAEKIIKNHENLTENAYIRNIVIKSESNEIIKLENIFKNSSIDNSMWNMNSNKTEIIINEKLLDFINLENSQVFLNYFVPVLKTSISYRHQFFEIPINRRRTLFVEKQSKLNNQVLIKKDISEFKIIFIDKTQKNVPEKYKNILGYELIEEGLVKYL